MDLERRSPGTLRHLEAESRRSRPPRQLADGRPIYSGKWRGFDTAFAAAWWRKQTSPWTCALCGKSIDPKGRGGAKPSIDHIEPWTRTKTEVETQAVCCHGVHWEVALTQDVRAALQDERNLRPTHQGCNSSKGGPKDSDSINPHRIGDCPGPGICRTPRALS